MATYFIRGLLQFVRDVPSGYYYCKQLALFLKNVVGYTFQSQSTTSGDFTTVEKQSSGAVGSVTGSSWILTDSSAPFSSADAGKFIYVKDATHPENSGVYPILKYLTSSTLLIDWLGADTDYPTASSTLSWWIASRSYGAPVTAGDYVRLKSPHSTGWALEIACNGSYVDAGAFLRVAVDGSWSGGRILGTAAVTGDYNNDPFTSFFVVASDDGDRLHCFLQDKGRGTNIKLTVGASVGIIDPIEPGRQPYELVALVGGGQRAVFYVPAVSRYTSQSYGIGGGQARIWSDRLGGQLNCYMGSYAAAGYKTSMTHFKDMADAATIWRENNPRLNNKAEVMYGTLIFAENSDGSVPTNYAVVGVLGGHWSTRGDFPRCQALSTDGTKWDRLHLGNGIIVEWPQQFTPREITPMSQSWL